MTHYLQYKIDKFIFRVAEDRYYTDDGLWVKPENNHVQIGISDYRQQRSGDVAFVEIKPEGTLLSAGEEFGVIETIKVSFSLTSPISGKVMLVNPILATSPEVINLDPYGNGWLVVLETNDGENSVKRLQDAKQYYSHIKSEAEQELNSK